MYGFCKPETIGNVFVGILIVINNGSHNIYYSAALSQSYPNVLLQILKKFKKCLILKFNSFHCSGVFGNIECT